MILSAKYTDLGGRSVNEDSCDIFCINNRACAVVADGLGSYGGGEVASSIAVNMIGEKFAQVNQLNYEILVDTIQSINREIYAAQTPEKPMKTTIAVLSMENGMCTALHIGDTRIYHFSENQLLHMTFDHSVSQMAVLTGEITQAQIRHHVDRNRLLRALGKEDDVKVEINKWEIAGKGLQAFLLCTDGFWEYVYESEMEETLCISETPQEWLSLMAGLLQKRVPVDCDNNTAVAVWYDAESR